jgi:hypothetical protein
MSGLTRLRLAGGGGADKNHQSLILQQTSSTKKKHPPPTGEQVTFVSDIELVRKVHDEVLIHAVRDMLHPLLAIKSIPLAEWETSLSPVHTRHAPPAYAKLQGPQGFGKYHTTARKLSPARLGNYLFVLYSSVS